MGPSAGMAWDTLEGRIRWLVEERAGGSARELARRAGLPEQHLAVFFERAAAKPTAELKLSTLTKLAAGARVSLPWLASNDGRPDDAFLVPAADIPDAPTPDRHEVEAAPRDATAEGRWHRYAAQHASFRAVATFRHRVEGVPDTVLDSAADELGAQKSNTGPSEEETDRAIDKWLKRTPARASKETREGREATADDFKMPAPTSKKAAAKKGARR
jgi:hypothetical protein